MIELFVFGVIALAVFAVFALLLTIGFVFKLAFRLLLLPLLLLKALISGLLLITVGPILFVVGVVVALAVGAALLVPLLPFLLLVGVIWLIVRPSQPAIAR